MGPLAVGVVAEADRSATTAPRNMVKRFMIIVFLC